MDELYEIKNYFYLANYQAVINEVNKRAKQLRNKADADFYLYRAYAALGDCDLVLREIKDSEQNRPLQAVRTLAAYLQSPTSNADIVLATVKQWIIDGLLQTSAQLQVIAATIYYSEGNFEEALRVLNKSDSLECIALQIQVYLKIDRLDLAEKRYSDMKKLDIDATPSQLAHAWIAITQGDDKIKEALSVYEELSEKYGPTSMLLNGRATCEILLKRFEKAENLLLLSLEKNPKDADTLANLIVCHMHMKKQSEVTNRYLNQLKTSAPKHPWVASQVNAEEAFDRCKTRYGM
ncbi:hypothetical protein SAMD00019534_001770 [Acytostelium subglobosum LB1]|uniref:hypothetical protein n=1 Tax=Acytostelium subglobosum LB1 TaxID=1410327 RepID=UPI000644AD64|nr:hypothetical protein SAMD00019534_001770 [Acytostelium subglobosum LB1]GAM17002.1 hypothetical protein SAMD00019534_001770 [Acytostelium subglobosum LB1]|eukprot:XP_012759064.1 hypothetical protein SAMD00019534_001770 [Acytostelium subglobosum LB1]